MSYDKIFGYDWEDIQKAQQKEPWRKSIDLSKSPTTNVDHLEADKALLLQHGEEKLRSMGFYGVIDRLERAGFLYKKVERI